MEKVDPRILIYGYGNPGRQDDGLGIMLSEEIEKWTHSSNLSNIDVDQNYQLNIEDAEKISKYDLVIFIDASVNDIKSFTFDIIKPDLKTDFSMHSVTPSFVVGICEQIFGYHPQAYQLQIKGYKWEFMRDVSSGAKRNLLASLDYLKMILIEKYVAQH
jgi:hydrogenase maturation protease